MALADNKVKIQALLDGINALPEAGSGEAPDPVLQEKAVTPTKAAQSVTPDTGYDGLSKVNVGAIPDEYIVPSGTVSITENGTHSVREAENVNVNVPAPEIALQEKTVTPTKETQAVAPDADYDGLSKVTVNAIPSDYIVPTGTKSITENGTHDVAAYASVDVAVPSEDISAETAEYTAQLDALETAIDSLPDAGSGGGTATVGFQTNVMDCDFFIHNNGETWSMDWAPPPASITALVGTVMFTGYWSATSLTVEVTGQVEIEHMGDGYQVFKVNGDGTITVST